MDLKIVIINGITTGIYGKNDGNEELSIEMVSIDKDYPDYDKLRQYYAKILADPSYKELDYTVADFEEE